jgi:hypothetical protein
MDQDEIKEVEDAILAHFGTKGMRWGVRTAKTVSALGKRNAEGTPVAVRQKGSKIVTKALVTASIKQIVNKSGINAATNAELKSAVERMKLETQFRQYSPPPPTTLQRVRSLITGTKTTYSAVKDNPYTQKVAKFIDDERSTTKPSKSVKSPFANPNYTGGAKNPKVHKPTLLDRDIARN